MSRPDPETLYTALISEPDRLAALRRMQYRCPSRCLLLDALALPDGDILLHQKRYKYSDGINRERSSEEGRAKNTFDGDRHWKPPGSYYIGSSALNLTDAEGATLGIQCDHVLVQLKPSEFRSDWDKGHAEVRIRADGTRYAL